MYIYIYIYISFIYMLGGRAERLRRARVHERGVSMYVCTPRCSTNEVIYVCMYTHSKTSATKMCSKGWVAQKPFC